MLDIVHILSGDPAFPPSLDSLLELHLSKQKAALETVAWGAHHVDANLAVNLVNSYGELSTSARAHLLLSPIVCETLFMCRNGISRDNLERLVACCADELSVEKGAPDRSDVRVAVWAPMGDVGLIRGSQGYIRYSSPRIDDVVAIDFDSPPALTVDLASACMCFPPENFTSEERDQVVFSLSMALSHIDRISSTYGRIVRNYTRVIRVRKSAFGATASEQVPRKMGQIYLLNPQRCSVEVLAESLLHESVHNLLSAYEFVHGAFVLTGSDQRYRPVSPWTGNPIPVESFCHAVFVWFALFNLAVREMRHGGLTPEETSVVQRQLNVRAGGFVVPARLSEYLKNEAHFHPGVLDVIDDLQQIVLSAVAEMQIEFPMMAASA